MKLQTSQSLVTQSKVAASGSAGGIVTSTETPTHRWDLCPSPQVGCWVKLLELPSPFSHHEALLLCQYSNEEWLTWVPDHGEIVLNIRQFC